MTRNKAMGGNDAGHASPSSGPPSSGPPLDGPPMDGSSPSDTASGERWADIMRLRRERPRRRFASWSLGVFFSLLVGAWFVGDFHLGDIFSAKRLENLRRFSAEAMPYPLQETGFDAATAFAWAHGVMMEKGWAGAATTLSISVLAIVLAGFFGAALSMFANRSLASSAPFVSGPRPPHRSAVALWALVVALTRFLLIIMRSIPAYLWAFLLLSMLGPTAWPAILALALHNTGILGKLAAEIGENLDPRPLAALSEAGASRGQVALFGIAPLTLPRFLLFFFYRWETCVRQATVLGMLGIVSLGFWIQDARARNHYDEMVLMILVSVVLVLVGDATSIVVRGIIRRRS